MSAQQFDFNKPTSELLNDLLSSDELKNMTTIEKIFYVSLKNEVQAREDMSKHLIEQDNTLKLIFEQVRLTNGRVTKAEDEIVKIIARIAQEDTHRKNKKKFWGNMAKGAFGLIVLPFVLAIAIEAFKYFFLTPHP